ncbi:Rha family transcriptional regulator [Comamonas aquatica]|uniref:Rha family transcriptional regulator n=1 Tax=Comamonas aquatica TaxID=225991 RepID=UPI0028D5AC96|nr:Rha family transcriptional regulator [Comamonas aquatica]
MQASIPGTTVAIATPGLEIIEGHVTTTSNQVAEHFSKRHADVIRAIRKLEAPAEFIERNFALNEFTDSIGRTLPAYRITRDGFTLLAMGFTGKEAMQWKVAYLTAFNKMEAQLLAQAQPQQMRLDYDRISPAQAQDLKEIVATIVKAGVQGYGETWARFQKKFHVNSYLELPATQHLEARNYLIAKLPKPSNVHAAPSQPAQLPRLHLYQTPPAVGTYRYNPANPHPANGRTIEVAKSIAADIRNWSDNLPASPARQDLHDAAQTLYDLLVSGWTEVDEALGQMQMAMHFLGRWQGRGGRIGNTR